MVSFEGGGISAETKNNVDLGRYAEITANLRRFSGELGSARVLARFGLSEETWASIDSTWSRAIDDDVVEGRNALVVAFAEVFSATRETLNAAALAAKPPEPAAVPQATFATQVPSYLLASDPTVASPSGPAGFANPDGRSAARSFKTEALQSFPAGSALPFTAARATSSIPTIPELSVERYASLCVELASRPQERADILLRYRLSEDQHATLDALWTHRMAREPGLTDAWRQACALYRDWLTRGSLH